MKRALSFGLLLLTGCVPLGNDSRLILGVGLVHLNHTNQVNVVRVKSLGLHAGAGQVNLGLSSITTVRIPTNSNTVLELRR